MLGGEGLVSLYPFLSVGGIHECVRGQEHIQYDFRLSLLLKKYFFLTIEGGTGRMISDRRDFGKCSST